MLFGTFVYLKLETSMKYKIDLDATETLMPTNYEIHKHHHPHVENARFMVLEDLNCRSEYAVFKRLREFYDTRKECVPEIEPYSMSDIALFILEKGLESMENGTYDDEYEQLLDFLDQKETLTKKITDALEEY